MIDSSSSEFKAALEQASSEYGLQDYYQPCVRPLLTMPMNQWPMCCGGSCEPCAQALVTVALRMCELLRIDENELGM
jgi:hypothetical protein